MDNHDGGKQPIPLTLPEWRNLPDSFEASMYQLALSHLEQQTGKQLVPFVFCLSQNLTNKARLHKNEAAYLSGRLKDALRGEFKEVAPHTGLL